MSEWVKETRGLVVERVNLDINHTCPLVIADSGSPECPEQLVIEFQPTVTTIAAPASSVTIVIAVTILVVVLILIVVIAMVILVVKRKRKATRSKKQVHFL